MQTTVIGVFEDMDRAEKAIVDLRELGVSEADISYLYTSSETEQEVESTGKTKAGDTAASGATAGAFLGAAAGLVVATGVLPGLGALLVAGPLAAALGLTGTAATAAAGAMTGAAAGGLVGALVGLGVSEREAKVYEERVRLGNILITARSSDPIGVQEIFIKHGAEEINEYRLS